MFLISQPETYYNSIQKDIENIYLSYGDEGGKEIVLNANNTFSILFTDTFLNRTAKTMNNTPNKDAAFFGAGQTGAIQSNKMIKTMKLEIYALFLRISIAARWIPVLIVLGVAAFIDGLVARKIKIEGYGFTSPGVQARMAHITIVLTGLSIIAMYLPINLPILWWPISTLIAVLCIRFVASNMKQITT